MNWDEIRSQFTVHLLLQSLDESRDIRHTLSHAQYEVFHFTDWEMVSERLKDEPPHVLVLEVAGLTTPVDQVISKCFEINPEIQILLFGPAKEAHKYVLLKDLNVAQYVSYGENREARILWSIDRICQALYRNYQNEALLEELESLKSQTDSGLIAPSAADAADVHHVPSETMHFSLDQFRKKWEAPILEYFIKLENATSKEEIIDEFFHYVKTQYKDEDLKCLYFKFLPTVQSFVITQSFSLDIDAQKGMAIKLTYEEGRHLMGNMHAGLLPEPLKQSAETLMPELKYRFVPLYGDLTLEGLVLLGRSSEWQERDLALDLQILKSAYQVFYYQNKLKSQSIYDPVTELFNRQQYYKKLEEEVSRARRIEKPVSLIKLSLDHFGELEQTLGVNNRNVILRTIARIIQKTGRVNDIACRTQDNELTLILPHCPKKRAALRAERVRRLIETHSFSVGGVPVTVSGGVSEYPTLCRNADELESTTLQSMELMQNKGGNQVCLHQPPDDFKPDFKVEAL